MAKIVYSLVLTDDVVAAIDTLASRQGLTRSVLVNNVLAQYASMSTPEMQAKKVFSVVSGAAANGLLRVHSQSAHMLTLRTTLGYKYNPTLSYTLDMRPAADGPHLRVGLRSQNSEVLAYYHSFFELWHHLEEKHLPAPPAQDMHMAKPQRYQRALRLSGAETSEELGESLAGYLSLLDSCINTFFCNLHSAEKAANETESTYLSLLNATRYTKNL